MQDLDEGDSTVINHNFIQSALSVLVPTLLEQLLKQEDDQDREDTAWNLSMAAGTCLDLMATVVEENILPLVIPFVQVALLTQPHHCPGVCDGLLFFAMPRAIRRNGLGP